MPNDSQPTTDLDELLRVLDQKREAGERDKERCIRWCHKRGIDPFWQSTNDAVEAWMLVTDEELESDG